MKIRRIPHVMKERDGTFQACILGGEPGKYGWEFSENIALKSRRANIDSCRRFIANIPEVESNKDATDLVFEVGTDNWMDDCEWLQDLTGLDGLRDFLNLGGVILTNKEASCVYLVEANYFESPRKCVYSE